MSSREFSESRCSFLKRAASLHVPLSCGCCLCRFDAASLRRGSTTDSRVPVFPTPVSAQFSSPAPGQVRGLRELPNWADARGRGRSSAVRSSLPLKTRVRRCRRMVCAGFESEKKGRSWAQGLMMMMHLLPCCTFARTIKGKDKHLFPVKKGSCSTYSTSFVKGVLRCRSQPRSCGWFWFRSCINERAQKAVELLTDTPIKGKGRAYCEGSSTLMTGAAFPHP